MPRLTEDDRQVLYSCKLERMRIKGLLAELRRSYGNRLSRMPSDVRDRYDRLMRDKRELSNEALAIKFECTMDYVKNI